MTIVAIDPTTIASQRLGMPTRRASGPSGHRLPLRLLDGSRMAETGMKAGLLALRHSRFEVGAPERL